MKTPSLKSQAGVMAKKLNKTSSLKSQTGVMAKKTQKRRNGAGRDGELDLCVGSRGRSTRKLQVSIKSQTGVMAKKRKEMGDLGAEVARFRDEVHTKTPGLYQVPMLRNLNFYFCPVCFRV